MVRVGGLTHKPSHGDHLVPKFNTASCGLKEEIIQDFGWIAPLEKGLPLCEGVYENADSVQN